MKNSTNKHKLLYSFALIIGFLIITLIGCKDLLTEQFSISNNSKVPTTVDRTIVPIDAPVSSSSIFIYEISKYNLFGYGNWQFGPGKSYERRLDLMPVSYNGASVANTAALLNFFALSDVHITDKESPVSAVFFGYKGKNQSAYSPVMLYTTQILNAAVKTINALNKEKPFDFGISLGDNSNTNQYNELRWFIDVMDGKHIIPDSGVKDDPISGPGNDYQDEFDAEGIDISIPWYQVLGNHDHLFLGLFPPYDYVKQTYIGSNILNTGRNFNPLQRGVYAGSFDGRTIYGDIYGVGLVESFATPPQVLAADPNRHSVSKEEWKNEFFNTSTYPVGHGLNLPSTIIGCYSFEPKSNMPIKVIVLDNTQDENTFTRPENGYLDLAHFNWLVSELDKGQSEGKLMIIAAHVPIDSIGTYTQSPVSKYTLAAKLNNYSNLLMWISGHLHHNTVIAYKSPDISHPELGFWQVETCSLREFPQQFRTFDICRNSDNTISVFVTNVDYLIDNKNSLAATARSYAVAAYQLCGSPINKTTYNAELIKQLSTEMQLKIQNYGTAIKN